MPNVTISNSAASAIDPQASPRVVRSRGAIPIDRPRPLGLYMTARSVRERYDNISDMTLFRWLRDARVAFPTPVYIGRRRFWAVESIIAWEKSRAAIANVSG